MPSAAHRTLTLPVSGLLTIADWLALGETDQRYELVEGNLVMAPSPVPRHNVAASRLFAVLDASLPAGLRAVPDVDVHLELGPTGDPVTVRRPDLMVVDEREYRRVGRDGDILRASGVVLVVEVVSPGSRRTDRLVKRREYADAGIAHYWIVELDPQVSLTACRLVDGDYLDDGPLTGTVTIPEPFSVRLDLDALVAE